MVLKRIYPLINFLILASLIFGEPLLAQHLTSDQVVKAQSTNKVFLPLVTAPQKIDRTVNLPYFAGDVKVGETAIFWFGKVAPADSYAEVRMGYSPAGVYFRLASFDSRIWYNPDASTGALSTITQWDGLTLYLNVAGGQARQPTLSSYKLIYQWNDDNLANHTAFYKGDGTNWKAINLTIPTQYEWRGNASNDNTNDDGWNINLSLPYNQFGVNGTPTAGSRWSMAIDLADRDSAAGPANAMRVWPGSSETAQIRFGIPGYSPARSTGNTTLQIRQGLNGTTVKDGMVGGSSSCGSGLDRWKDWGDKNYYGNDFFVVQNQIDYADFPCFSKEYLEFPLSAIPTGKVIVSAKLIIHLFGNSDPNGAQPSYMQLMRFKEDWNPQTVTWNTAPIVLENYAATVVNPISNFNIVWPGYRYEFDASRAVNDAYQQGSPLKLVLYDADTDYHSGKYFTSSFAEDWDAVGRPTIEVVWGNP